MTSLTTVGLVQKFPKAQRLINPCARAMQFVAGPRGVLELEVLRVFVLVARGWLQR